MKKLIVVLLVGLIMLSLCGCYFNKVSDETSGKDGRIAIVYNDGFAQVFRDNETGVQYFVRADSGACVMVDKDGNPYIG